MADSAGSGVLQSRQADSSENKDDAGDMGEPQAKRTKFDNNEHAIESKLEDRLTGILCCAVCLDVPQLWMYQCTNGHLMCASCLSHLLADGRLKDETPTCPGCRCEISRTLCNRNLAVEKAISELPAACQFCMRLLPRAMLKRHEAEVCQQSRVRCDHPLTLVKTFLAVSINVYPHVSISTTLASWTLFGRQQFGWWYRVDTN